MSKNKKKKVEYLGVPLLKERGWTKTMIDTLMPMHDDEWENPRYKSAYPMKVYKKVRVERFERNRRWKEMHAKSLVRIAAGKKAAKKALETKRKNAIREAKNVDVDIVKIEEKEVLKLAIDHYNDRNGDYFFSRGKFKSYASLKSDPDFLERITVNFIRHELTSYEYELYRLSGVVGRDCAYQVIKNVVLDKIAEVYPHLACECEGQKEFVCEEAA